jgi:pilus assembly protein Flp/PilA
MLKFMRRLLKDRKGQGIVEYGILVGGIALVCLAAVAILGHKTNDLVAVVAAALPGAHDEDNGAIVSGQLVNTVADGNGNFVLDGVNPGSMSANLGIADLDGLVADPFVATQ